MKKIIASIAVVLLAGAVIATGMSTAFFSDTETSTGNVFASGAIDLLVDNESYYNGNKCTDIDGDGPGTVFQWKGTAAFPVPDTPCDTSWNLDNLNKGHLFFNFKDVKPDDESEDTISLHVQNDAWACMDLTLTSDDDESSTEPELLVDVPDVPLDVWDGELAQNIDFVWWADDGDNVLEEGEHILTGDESVQGGVETLYNLATTTPFSVSLADKDDNVWGTPGPLPANKTVYIAKAWCFGDVTLAPLTAGTGVNPSVGSGVLCDGTGLGNETQTDSATLDVQFRTVQARHNPNFQCEPPKTTLTLVKDVINNNAGTTTSAAWTLNAAGPTPLSGASGSPGVTGAVVTPGSYDLSESGGPAGYVASAWVCVGGTQNDGDTVTLAAGESATCTITNDDVGTSLTLKKEVVGIEGGPDEQESAWTLSADGPVTDISGPGPTVNSPANFQAGTYNLSEVGPLGYTPSAWVCVGGTQNDSDTVTVGLGESATCTITNTEDEVLACNADLDLMLVLDRSGSIDATELQTLKTAAHAFVNTLAPSTLGAHIGQSSFSTTATLDLHLTDDEAAAHLAINALAAGGTTDLEAGITTAIGELDNTHVVHERPATPDVMVVITDGNPNVPNEATGKTDAAAAADTARLAGIEVYAVGVGVSTTTEAFLKADIADDPAHYFAAADFDDLEAILQGLVACDSAKKNYTFVGVTNANDGTGGNPIAFEHDSDVWPWTSVSDVNGSSTPSDVQYTSISTDNNTRWISGNPGGGDFMVKNFRFDLTEALADIDDIKILWKGQPDTLATTTIWALKTALSPYVAANWVQIGGSLAIPSDTDRYIVRHIPDADVETYVSAGGVLDIMVAIDNENEVLRTDYVTLLVTSSP